MVQTRSPGFHKTIRFKIVLIFSTTFILVSLLAGIWIYRELSTLITAQDSKRLLSRAESLTDRVEISPLIIPLPEEGEQIRFRYYGKDFDTVLFQSPHFVVDHVPDSNAALSVDGDRVVRVLRNTENSSSDWIELVMITPDTLAPALHDIEINITLAILISMS